MRKVLPLLLLLSPFISVQLSDIALAQNWKAEEVIEYYPVKGSTAPELYRSIGENGPKVNEKRAMALTSYVLRWKREFAQENNRCVIKSAIPLLKITYTIPKFSGKNGQKLSPELNARWNAFTNALYQHELEHGAIIKNMVEELTQESLQLKTADDPQCKRMRKVLADLVNEYVARQRKEGQNFDRAEMARGGPIEREIYKLMGK